MSWIIAYFFIGILTAVLVLVYSITQDDMDFDVLGTILMCIFGWPGIWWNSFRDYFNRKGE